MLSGCCVVTTPHHDAGSFIIDGNNGFLVERDPEDVANLIEGLIHRPDEAITIGAKGKQTAELLFSWDRFARDWKRVMALASGQYR